jgi:hypothetical protein
MKTSRTIRNTQEADNIAFVVRCLRDSVTILCLICENTKKHAQDEKFLMDLFGAISDQVRKINKVIQTSSHIDCAHKITLRKLHARKPLTRTPKKKGVAVKKEVPDLSDHVS